MTYLPSGKNRTMQQPGDQRPAYPPMFQPKEGPLRER